MGFLLVTFCSNSLKGCIDFEMIFSIIVLILGYFIDSGNFWLENGYIFFKQIAFICCFRYTDTGFTVNGVDYEGSLLCVGNLLMSWSPKTILDITTDRYMYFGGLLFYISRLLIHWTIEVILAIVSFSLTICSKISVLAYAYC